MNALLLFIRNPEPGKVKTRLAAGVGHEKALEVYRFLLEHTRQTAEAVTARRLLFYSETMAENDGWDPLIFEKHLQTGHDLGERMFNAFETAFEAGATHVVIVGSDCPELTSAHLDEAFQLLDAHDAVLGPSADGGYYLLGLKKNAPELFENMTWSVDTVFGETVKRLKNTGKSVALLPVLNDIDTEEDWRNFGRLVY